MDDNFPIIFEDNNEKDITKEVEMSLRVRENIPIHQFGEPNSWQTIYPK